MRRVRGETHVISKTLRSVGLLLVAGAGAAVSIDAGLDAQQRRVHPPALRRRILDHLAREHVREAGAGELARRHDVRAADLLVSPAPQSRQRAGAVSRDQRAGPRHAPRVALRGSAHEATGERSLSGRLRYGGGSFYGGTRRYVQYDSASEYRVVFVRLNYIFRPGDDIFVVVNRRREARQTAYAVMIKAMYSIDF